SSPWCPTSGPASWHRTPTRRADERPAPSRGLVGGVSARTTMAQLAREAGVSVPTVSKVLNGRADVADATRARVEGVIQKHGYRRRRTSAAVPARMVDLVFHQIESPWALELI